MELKSIRDTFDRVAEEQKLSSSKTQEVIELIRREIQQALDKLQSGEGPGLQPILNELNTKLMESGHLGQLQAAQEQLDQDLPFIEYEELLERSLHPELSKAYRKVEFDTDTIKQIIASYFFRQGLFDIGDSFVSEAEVRDADSMRSSFLEMHTILSAMETRNLEPALNWATINRDKLKEIGSDLELKMRSLQFVEILKQGKDSINEALEYTRDFLAPLRSDHTAEINKLIGCLAWIGELDDSPYPELLSTLKWDKVVEEFTRQFWNLLGQSRESPLSVTVAAGVQGLPPHLKEAMAGTAQELESVEESPVYVELDREFQFHSIFVCEISARQATVKDPPMLMSCKHVFSLTSIQKMTNSGGTFKCPYCQKDTQASDRRQLYL